MIENKTILEYGQKVLKYKGRVVFEKLSLPYFKRMPKEYFEKEACFLFVNQGEFSVRAPDQSIRFEKGSGLLAKCLNYFFETDKKQRKIDEGIEVIAVVIYPDLVNNLFQYDLSTSKYVVDYNLKKIELNELLYHYKESVNLLIDHPEIADEQFIKNKLKEFIILMTKQVDAPSELDFLSAMFKPNFAQFEEVINRNLYASLNIHELAVLCHMSLSSFKRKFKESYQESPMKYIKRLRIERASAMLRDKTARISDIAYSSGFESMVTFNRVFKLHFGKSPSEYRELI